MNPVAREAVVQDLRVTKRKWGVDSFLLGSSVLALVVSCLVWSAHKQAWMDEIMTWKEASDPSLWHLYWAIQHGADGGQPLFYATIWIWRHIFGGGVLTLRLYSCAAMCGALVIVWKTIRRHYGVWATAFGVLMIWGTSTTVLDQNAEARFYGLYMLVTAVALYLYCRLAEQKAPDHRLLAATLLTQAALVLTHVLGIVCGGLLLLAQVLSDAWKRRFRPRVYLSYIAGWLALLVWIPAIRASMAVGKPQGWILMPHLRNLQDFYTFESCQEWILLLAIHRREFLFHLAHHLVQCIFFLPLGLMILVFLRRKFASHRQNEPEERSEDVLLAAFALLLMPVALFVISHLLTPVFLSRYLLPSYIGMAIVFAALAESVGARLKCPARPLHAARVLLIALLLLCPIGLGFGLVSPHAVSTYLDIQRVERDLPPGAILVAPLQDDFQRLMRFGSVSSRYYFLLDWPTALRQANGLISDYHLLSAYKDAGYYSKNIQDQNVFLCSHTDFYVLDTVWGPGRTWFDLVIENDPAFEWKLIDKFPSPKWPSGISRRLVVVHRVEALPACP